MAELIGRIQFADFLIGSSGTGGDYMLGDARYLTGTQRGGNDILVAMGLGYNYLGGDADDIIDSARGGHDILIAASSALFNRLCGDAQDYLRGPAIGGNDLLIGGDDTRNFFYGDAPEMGGSTGATGTRLRATGGNDTLLGGDRSVNLLYGDGQEISGSDLGDDLLIGGRKSTNLIAGDGFLVFSSLCGNDRLRGGANSDNRLHGDADFLFGQGGDDRIVAGRGGTNLLYGDAYQMLGRAVGGDDLLVSWGGDDDMWGDAKFRSGIYLGEAGEDEWYEEPPLIDDTTGGADTFRFRPGNGNDTIHDFEPGKDRIELRGFDGIDGIDDLAITEARDGSARIDLGSGNSITVIGTETLRADDFIFT